MRAEREILVQGDEWFRPVAIAAAPDGAIFFTDWVDQSYSVHEKGRIWRLAEKSDSKQWKFSDVKLTANPARQRMNRLLEEKSDFSELLRALSSCDPFIRSAAVSTLARPAFRERVLRELDAASPQKAPTMQRFKNPENAGYS